MVIKFWIFILYSVVTFSWAGLKDFTGEILYYSAGFRVFPAGQAILSFTADSLDGKAVFLLITSVKTNSFLDTFYKVRDEIQSWLNPENLSLKKTIQKIREVVIIGIINQ